MKSILLFGPFIGSLSFEFYRFAPYSIYMKKTNPNIKIAVLTRQERFDLYGQYADFLVPLKIKGDNVKNQIGFKLKGFSEYNKLARQFKNMYSKRFNIKEHYYPDIIDYRFKIHWQYPRFKMDYDFKPRNKNMEIIKNAYPNKKFILLTPPYDTEFIDKFSSCIIKNKLHKKYIFLTCGEFGKFFLNINDLNILNETSKLGYIISIMKKSKIVIGPKSDLTHLSLLLKCPVISWGNNTNINLINPLKTKIMMYDKIPKELIKNYLVNELERNKHETDYDRI